MMANIDQPCFKFLSFYWKMKLKLKSVKHFDQSN